MSARLHGTDENVRTDVRLGVGVELAGWLVARAGVDRAQMALVGDSTVVDAVEKLAEQGGPQIRPALLRGNRLRQDTVAKRLTDGEWVRVNGDEKLSHGDRLRFEAVD